ncbi:MAG: tRNA glutamyl-Q(34) synthetase GluQRS [Betaproteobacteria bacterium]|nr:tRNA glutamyl-Q(34) synthetase GluQRS [Betaproteobacteria bacterium]
MSISSYVGRFAPSPTGPLHFGSLVAAVASYLDARHAGGRWLVRIEDIDTPRCKPEHARSILETLTAFGFRWEGAVEVQSQRTVRYASALDRLRGAGMTYACACSRKEIADSALSGIDGPVYPGTCRHMALPETRLAIRLRTDDLPIAFTDRCQGPQTQHLETGIGDFVLRRRDGLFSYQLAVVVDDAEQGVTDVVRGADLIDSTARQIHLQRLLGFSTPRYLHIPVATNPSGQKLSKQTLAPAIGSVDASAALNRALQFLGQPEQAYAKPAEVLAAAVPRWNPAAMPRLRQQPTTEA